jgi:hypothetical protein
MGLAFGEVDLILADSMVPPCRACMSLVMADFVAKSVILVVGLALGPLEADSDLFVPPDAGGHLIDYAGHGSGSAAGGGRANELCKAAKVLRDGAERELILCAAQPLAQTSRMWPHIDIDTVPTSTDRSLWEQL